MKKLTKIRLINWHYLDNETIAVKNNILITGQNGTGKSTILDAITFVLTAGDQMFNLAANDKGKRDLRGYVKCKLGSSEKEYLRDYDVTSHIALEFYSEKQNKFFVVGTVIDVVGEINAVTPIFYSKAGQMDESMFVREDGYVKTAAEFKKTKSADEYYLTKKDAKSAFRARFGGVSEKYFKLIPKALAFKPINDVKEFIYQHLLEEKSIDVENIKDSIRAYKEFELILKEIKTKIEDLKDMTSLYEEIIENREKKIFYEYLIKVIDVENHKILVKNKEKEIDKLNIELQLKKNEIQSIDDEFDNLDERSKEIYATLQNDEEFNAEEVFEKEKLKLTQELQNANSKKRNYFEKVKALKNNLIDVKEVNPDVYQRIMKVNFDDVTKENIGKLKVELLSINKIISERIIKAYNDNAFNDSRRQTLLIELNEVYKTLKELENNKISYNPQIVFLRNQIMSGLKQKYGYDISVHILAELLEVTKPEWQDAIEEYLSSTRFNLIVEPRYFDDALKVYNDVRGQKLFGVGLVNTKKIGSFNNYQPNSMASIIKTDNADARHYINFIVGNLILCENVYDLEKYNQAITMDGMLYKSFVVRALNKNIEKPFIGKGALGKQTEKFHALAIEKKNEYQELQQKISAINANISQLESADLKEIIDLVDINISAFNLKEKLDNLQAKARHMSDHGINDLRHEYELIKQEMRTLNMRKNTLYEELGSIRTNIDKAHQAILTLQDEIRSYSEELAGLAANNVHLEKQVYDTYNNEVANQKNVEKVQNEYHKLIDVELRNIKSSDDLLSQKQFKYTTKYNLAYPFGFENMDYYLKEQDKLIKSELVKYESKVRESRESAEKLFKEDFLSKLRNYIMTAQDEIQKINLTLKKIKFGQDTYEFVFPKSKEYSSFYEMVTDDANISEGFGIFTQDFERKYARQLEELFDDLAKDELNNNGSLSKYTDYRTYMDYDLRIYSADEEFMYSKISKEKSGGETQIPFYVAVIASFVRLFDQATKTGLNDSVGLILFDEVFDKMDPTRIKAMMEFIKNLDVQIILATPPQKLDGLAEYTDTQVVTLRTGKRATTYQTIRK